MNKIVALVIALACSVLAACGTTKPAQENDKEPLRPGISLHAATGACGVELWSIKTLTDPNAGTVNLAPSATTLAILRGASPPTFSYTRPRSTPIETQAWTVTATLTGYKLEADSDVHLVLDDNGDTMIAEIPDPACAVGSRVLAQITAARKAFETDHNLASQCFSCLNETVTITGIGFFDALHGQTGVAPNGVELHPVISYVPGGSPPPPPTTGASTTTAPPTTATVTTTSSTTSSTTTSTVTTPTVDDTLDERPGCNLYPRRIYFNHVKQNHCQANYFTAP